MDSLPIVLPAEPVEPKRPPVPFMAALVPVVAGVILWLVTGSLLALCFSALGPVMVCASLIDGARVRRVARTRARSEHDAAWAQAEDDLRRRHADERERQRRRFPDVAGCLAEPPLRSAEPLDRDVVIVVGSGDRPSTVRATGADSTRAREFQERCGTLTDAPVTVPLGGGVCVRGAAPVRAAVVRALAAQLCLRFSPAQLALTGERDALAALGLDGFPHVSAARHGGLRVRIGSASEGVRDADAVICFAGLDEDVPDGVTTVLDVTEPRRAELRTPSTVLRVEAEGVSFDQACGIAASAAAGAESPALPDSIALADLSQPTSDAGLPAALGRGESDDVVLDIVEDGPHAIVTGTTGTGKSELLVSWVSAIAATHGPSEVSFVLADFKGGTAFEPLRALPQVAAVITDLDDAGARRGVSSLTAELRRRESALASAGARDVGSAGLSRLVIVVDEFAALVQEHPDLAAVFTDIAARGRALGMHLILGTQRASGVIRDALAANCPLRVSLRVAEASESRLMLGTDAAAELAGGAPSRGLALVRRPQDAGPCAMRVALTSPGDLRLIAARWATAEPAASPWLAPLPHVIALRELHAHRGGDAVVLGRADVPERQQQPEEILLVGQQRGLVVLGAPGTGRTSLLRAIAAQRPDALWMPHDGEAAWDALHAIAEGKRDAPALVLCDDLDAQLAQLPPEFAQVLAHRWEHLVRSAAGTTFVLTAARCTGPAGRILDLLPARALLRMPSRVEHVAAGGEASGFDSDRRPGRALFGGREVQLAWVGEQEVPAPTLAMDPAPWAPRADVSALVTPAAQAVVHRLAQAYPECEVRPVAPEAPVRGDRPVLLVAEADTWQRNWALWQRVRDTGEALIRAECAAELRQLGGVRETPPYARTHAGRAWSLTADAGITRVVIPALVGGG